MSFRAMHSAASGMNAHMLGLDTIANNLANAGTTAFKRSRTNFEDLFYEHIKPPGTQDAQGNFTPTGISVGLGTRVASTVVDHTTGSLQHTEQPLDVAIAGEGFFQVQNLDGTTVYTRAGTFTTNTNGDIVLSSADAGRFLIPNIQIPQGATDVGIDTTGNVSYREAGSTTITTVGPIQTATFVNPAGLLQIGENLYAESSASGTPTVGIPGLEGRGSLRQGFLESSNVDPVRELVDLIKTQRNFELNSQTVQASDQMLQLISNLRRF